MLYIITEQIIIQLTPTRISMAQRLLSIFLLLLLGGIIASSSVTAQDDSYQPGYIDWQVNPVEQLFVEGMTEGSVVLQRDRPDQTEGGISLDDSIKYYETGISLKNHCEKKLKNAEVKIKKVIDNKIE